MNCLASKFYHIHYEGQRFLKCRNAIFFPTNFKEVLTPPQFDLRVTWNLSMFNFHRACEVDEQKADIKNQTEIGESGCISAVLVITVPSRQSLWLVTSLCAKLWSIMSKFIWVQRRRVMLFSVNQAVQTTDSHFMCKLFSIAFLFHHSGAKEGEDPLTYSGCSLKRKSANFLKQYSNFYFFSLTQQLKFVSQW